LSEAIAIRDEVAEALRQGKPIVALESTLIAHGLPYPDNLELAREVEVLVRGEGGVPATIAVVGGVPKVGLGHQDLELMATGEGVAKLSVRDIPMAVVKKGHGATTVAGTAHLAARAGIKLFATGGLGGVHRSARDSWDVSADLSTLSRTPVAVVCSGVKSILDVAATLEYLETLGVPVVGFRTRRFPGFYLADSGSALDWDVKDEEEAAQLIASVRKLGLEGSGLVITNGLSREEQLDPELHDRVLKDSLGELKHRGIRGKSVTPFLLDRFQRETKGESMRVNKQIVRNNARLAARIAAALAILEAREGNPATKL
jgi:pseudouridine-5'-phosphate glycosidase